MRTKKGIEQEVFRDEIVIKQELFEDENVVKISDFFFQKQKFLEKNSEINSEKKVGKKTVNKFPTKKFQKHKT